MSRARTGTGPVSVEYTKDGGIVLYVWAGVVDSEDEGCWVRLSVEAAQRLAGGLSRALIASGVMRGSSHRDVPCAGGKRRYATAEAARLAHVSAGWRVRTYLCTTCDGYHVANGDKASTAS